MFVSTRNPPWLPSSFEVDCHGGVQAACGQSQLWLPSGRHQPWSLDCTVLPVCHSARPQASLCCPTAAPVPTLPPSLWCHHSKLCVCPDLASEGLVSPPVPEHAPLSVLFPLSRLCPQAGCLDLGSVTEPRVLLCAPQHPLPKPCPVEVESPLRWLLGN